MSNDNNQSAEFERLCRLEPRLEDLRQYVLRLRTKPGDRLQQWYGEVKPQLLRLVGWQAERIELANPEAYDTAYDFLLELLERGRPNVEIRAVAGAMN